MTETFSDDFKKIFLLSFTWELIKHSERRDILKLKQIVELKEGKKEQIPSVISFESEPAIVPRQRIAEPQKRIFPTTRLALPPRRIIHQALVIPEAKLPAHLEYLKPIPAPGIEIDLPKINPLINDSAVRMIEGNPDEKVVVSGTMGTKPTGIVLSKEDIDEIIKKFSEVSKIPITTGIYRVVVGSLNFSAIVSDVISSRFVIKKILPSVQTNPSVKGPIKQRFFR